jgi:hypothetical protein
MPKKQKNSITPPIYSGTSTDTDLSVIQTCASSAKEVQVRIIFLRIGEIDTLNEKFYAEILIESKWEDLTLENEFNTNVNFGKHEKDLIEANKYWNPKIYIENSINESKDVHYKIRREVEAAHDIKTATTVYHQPTRFAFWLYEYQHLKGYFFEKLELDYFPVDIQNLSVTLTTTKSLNEVKFIQMKSKLSYVQHNTLDKHIWHLYQHVEVCTSIDNKSVDTEILLENPHISVLKRPRLSIPVLRRTAASYLHSSKLTKAKYETVKHPLIQFHCKAGMCRVGVDGGE